MRTHDHRERLSHHCRSDSAFVVRPHGGVDNHVAWSPDGRYLVSTNGRTIYLSDPVTGRLVRRLGDWTQGVPPAKSVDWSPGGRRLATAHSHQIRISDPETGAVVQSLEGGSGASLAWSPDRPALATGNGNLVQIWDTTAGVILETLGGHIESVMAVAWSPDGHRLATGSHDRTVRIWQVFALR